MFAPGTKQTFAQGSFTYFECPLYPRKRTLSLFGYEGLLPTQSGRSEIHSIYRIELSLILPLYKKPRHWRGFCARLKRCLVWSIVQLRWMHWGL